MSLVATSSPVSLGATRRPERDWTLMYVLDGDNDLREAATLDMVELDRSGAPENTNVVAQLYRGELDWNFRNFPAKMAQMVKPSAPSAVKPDWRGMKVFEVRTQDTDEVTSQVDFPDDSSRSNDPNSLAKFLAWSMREYPAKNYAVVLSGHGGKNGILSGSDGEKMPFTQVSDALKAASESTGKAIDVVLFDACGTASEKSAEAMRGSTSFLVASESPIVGKGWSESETLSFLQKKQGVTAEDFATSFLNSEHGIESPILYRLARDQH